MTDRLEHRLAPDRRSQPRGGRRRGDIAGYAPMVFVIDEDTRRREISEAILAKLRFAVAPFESLDKAISVMQALRPDIVIAREEYVDRLAPNLPRDKDDRAVPLLPITESVNTAEALVEAVRRTLRDRLAAV